MRSMKIKLEIDNLILIRIDVKISFSHTIHLKYNFYRDTNLFKFNVEFNISSKRSFINKYATR